MMIIDGSYIEATVVFTFSITGENPESERDGALFRLVIRLENFPHEIANINSSVFYELLQQSRNAFYLFRKNLCHR